ncbi:unnamed protein product [Peniophora sp. CBMAI 1063]|nr:unnamed protein product [Peniophora sp. CBMAI 1063]
MHGVDTLLSPVSTDCLLEVVEEGIHRPFEPFLKVDYLKPKHRPEPLTLQPRPTAQTTPPRSSRLSSTVLLIVFTLVSLIFTGSLSFAFFGERNSDVLGDLLKDAADALPSGILLLGENVDVDVDEPSITVRWSLIACGPGVALNGSEGIHGIAACGLPNRNISVFVDDAESPALVFSPSNIPYLSSSGMRRHIQALSQFDADYVLDVHEAHLYPMDRYSLSTTMFALDTQSSTPIPIEALHTIHETMSFSIASSDSSTYHALSDGSRRSSRELRLSVSRPTSARIFIFSLWATNWLLAHAAVGLILLTVRNEEYHPGDSPALAVLAILLAIPRLREAMPDGPGLDGVLIDTVGYFPQMALSGICAVTLLFLAAKREMDGVDAVPQADAGTRGQLV